MRALPLVTSALALILALGCKSGGSKDPVETTPEPKVDPVTVEPRVDPDVAAQEPQGPEVEFRLADHPGDVTLTEKTELELSPRLLALAFGPPLWRETYESAGEYEFTHGEMRFRVYDPGLTTLTKKCGLGPRDLWMSDRPVKLAVAGNSDTTPFVEWLNAELAAAVREDLKPQFQAVETIVSQWSAGSYEPKNVEVEARRVGKDLHLDAYGPKALPGPRFAKGGNERSSMADTWRQRKGAPCADDKAAAGAVRYPAHDPRSILLEAVDLLSNATKTLTLDDVPALTEFMSADAGTESRAWIEWKAYRKGKGKGK